MGDAALNVAFALWRLAGSDDGEDELIKANAAPLLLKATEAEDDSAKAASRSLAMLASHEDGRGALAKLAQRAASSDRARVLLGWAMRTPSAFRAQCEVSSR